MLPAHEYRFAGAEERIARLREKVDERLGELRALDGGSVWEIAQRLSWSRPWEGFTPLSQRLALGAPAASRAATGRRPRLS